MQFEKLQTDSRHYEISPSRGLLGVPRWLPPAPSAPSPARVLGDAAALGARDVRQEIEQALCKMFGAQHAQLLSSGKAALTYALRIARAKRELHAGVSTKHWVACGAYTCPDIAAAAVRAGFSLALCDIHPETLALRLESLPVPVSELTAVIHSNLYGVPEPLLRAPDAAAGKWAPTIIDDGSQSALSSVAGVSVGGRGDLGVISFGRGKAFSAIGGGAIVAREAIQDPEAAARDENRAPLHFATELRELLSGIATWLLAMPELYGIPARIPALKLGETHYEGAFREGPLSSVGAYYAFSRLRGIQRARESLQASRFAWEQRLAATHLSAIKSMAAEVAYGGTRFAALCGSATQRGLLVRRLRRFGATASYPRTLAEYEELRGLFVAGELQGAKAVRDRIVTLPCGPHVREGDMDRVQAALRE